MTITRQQIMAAVAAGNATLAEIAEHCKCREQDVRKPCSNAKTNGLLESYLDDVTGSLAYKLTDAGRKWRTSAETDAPEAAEPTGTSDEAGTAPAVNADFARDPELQYLAPEDYKLPPGDPGLLASANRELSKQLDAWRAMAANYDAETPAQFAEYLHSIGAELANRQALATKLQTLLDSKTHECEALRNNLQVTRATIENMAAAEPCDEADLETVSLADLVAAVSTFIDSEQSLTVFPAGQCAVNAFDKAFLCSAIDAKTTLDAASMLAMREAA